MLQDKKIRRAFGVGFSDQLIPGPVADDTLNLPKKRPGFDFSSAGTNKSFDTDQI
jgi:hypothetical protein